MPVVDWNMVATIAWGIFTGVVFTLAIGGVFYGAVHMAADSSGDGGIGVFCVVLAFGLPLSLAVAGAFVGTFYALWEYGIPLVVTQITQRFG